MAPISTATAPRTGLRADPEGEVWGQARGSAPGQSRVQDVPGLGAPRQLGQGWDGKGGAGAGPGGIPRGR